MSDRTDTTRQFSIKQARGIVSDLFTPDPRIYWGDFLLSMVGGTAGFALARYGFSPLSVPGILSFVICGLFLYRAVLFIHELVHIRDERFNAFRVVWNMLCGIPFLIPTFLYYTHLDHHRRRHYGTDHDGEYLPFGTSSPIHIFTYMCQAFVLPVIAVARFLILTPLCWTSPTIRDLVCRRASALVIDPSYIRPVPTPRTLRMMRLQEGLCFLWCASLAVLLITGIMPIGLLVTVYCLAVFILLLNGLRTLGAHRYANAGGKVTFLAQLLDSVNYPTWPLVAALWAPVGLRFHALHHLFPSLPYHNLAKAHRRLMAQLPAGSPYRLTESPGLVCSLSALWGRSRAAAAAARRHIHDSDQDQPRPMRGTDQNLVRRP